MKTFEIPEFYRSELIRKVRQFHKDADPKRKDVRPALLRLDTLEFIIPRHFGFCYGVENAVDIAFRAVRENRGKRVFLLSQMIHNPIVNQDLNRHGVQFLQDTNGNILFPFENLNHDDIVIIPAFGAPLKTLELLEKQHVEIHKYDTTCPFVERVWKKSQQIGTAGFTVIVHGKYRHEETRSTFSRVMQYAPASVVILNMNEARQLEPFILEQDTQENFEKIFAGKFSPGFNIHKHFNKIGVVNQTTMLASETQEIASYLKEVMKKKFGDAGINEHFADTRDTLCYATHENQEATQALLNTKADAAFVIGGYNSSNTSHLLEILETKFNVFFIQSAENILPDRILHYNIHQHSETETFFDLRKYKRFIVTGGASCPDSLLNSVIERIWFLYTGSDKLPEPHIEFYQ
jgi:4-hydroxy-3-methylbut-2-enyl diphosphate reductase